MDDKYEIAVSVYCMTYNHEKYIRDTLDGFITQKTTFKYEVLVHDDASTDGTANIIKKYAEAYPDIIKPILQTENQYSRGIYIEQQILWPHTRGKYIAFCEGDDYWSDPYKLQMQFDVMEQHENCSICSHYVRWIDMTQKTNGGFFPDKIYGITDGIVDKKIQFRVTTEDLFHLTSLFLRRNIYDKYAAHMPEFATTMPVGDVAVLLYFAKFGTMYFIDREMSVYRRGTEGSWTQRILGTRAERIQHYMQYITALEQYKSFIGNQSPEQLNQIIRFAKVGLADARKDYKTLARNMDIVRKIGGIKYVLKVYACRTVPFIAYLIDKDKK